MSPALDFNNLTNEELQEEYNKLYERYKQLREISETDAQRIHDLKRNLETANAAEIYLTQELDQLNSALRKAQEDVQEKMEHKLEDLRCKYKQLSDENVQLRQDYGALEMQRDGLLEQLEKAASAKPPDVIESLITEEQQQREQQLEKENLYLLEKLEEFQETNVRQTLVLAEREKNNEILRDQVKCMEENMNSKREELEELTQLLESTQEQLMEANAKIAMLTSAPGNDAKKGNSLFAEVDDQRQAMKQLLAAQKKNYMQMKKIYNESQHEIRRLKRENIAMQTELQACSSIFCSADKTYQDRLNERIKQLLNQNEKLTSNLNWTQERLKELACDKGVIWLDSMMNFCKQETDELKKSLHSVRIQKASLEEQLRNSQQEMARWRFESLRSRCVLMDRENILTENKIDFKPSATIEKKFSADELKTARPRIQSVTSTTINSAQELCEDKNIENKPANAIESVDIKIQTHDDSKINKDELKSENKENEQHDKEISHEKFEENSLIKKEYDVHDNKENLPLSLSELAVQSLKKEDHSNMCRESKNACNNITTHSTQKILLETINVDDDDDIEVKFATTGTCKSSPKPSSPSKPHSILCKNKSLIPKEISKTVQFSATECQNTDNTPPSKSCPKIPTTPKIHKKSNVIVRRVVIKSKHDA